MSFRSFVLALSSHKWVEGFVKGSPITRGIVRRFIAGESWKSAVPVAEKLCGEGFRVSLDCLGEHVSKSEEAQAATKEYLELIEAISRSKHCGGSAPENINISIKLSQLGMLLDTEQCYQRLIRLLSAAAQGSNFVRVDMEDSSTVDKTIEIVTRARETHPNVGVVLQAMLKRTKEDAAFVIKNGIRTRLVKGAYLESEAVAYQDKQEIDAAYLALGKMLMVEGSYTAFATHDPRLCDALCEFADQANVGSGRFEFQMLYGINRPLQQRLHKAGYTVRIYVPYGMSWYPYFSRRIAERPANLLFFMRSLFSR